MADWVLYRYPSQGSTPSRPKPVAEPSIPFDFSTHDALGRVISTDRGPGASLASPTSLNHSMDFGRGSISSASTHSTINDTSSADFASKFYSLRHGRRYLRDLPYPLPCDLPELQRQNLHTLLATQAFGKPTCAPWSPGTAPQKVLEVGCGSGYWSSQCHEYFSSLGFPRISFTGLDIVPLAPDFSKQGMDWRFVQHDLRRVPMPFDDAEFDLVVLKDLSMAVALGQPSQRMLDECCRVLKTGGVLEIWEADHNIRSLLPHPPPTIGTREEDLEHAMATATFIISPGTPFANAPNQFLQDANTWIAEALGRRKLSPTPCTRVAEILLQEPDTLGDLDYRRIAIPLGELRWEKEAYPHRHALPLRRHESEPLHRKSSRAAAAGGLGESSNTLSDEQAALRYTALLVVIQLIESLEPILKEVSGKNAEEWQRWWAWMMRDLLEERNAGSGECLELGAWWVRKLARD